MLKEASILQEVKQLLGISNDNEIKSKIENVIESNNKSNNTHRELKNEFVLKLSQLYYDLLGMKGSINNNIEIGYDELEQLIHIIVRSVSEMNKNDNYYYNTNEAMVCKEFCEDIMNKYGFSIILDYYPYVKRNKKKEFEEFIQYLSAVMPIDRSVIAVVSEAKDVLFGKGKSNYTKAVELINMQNIAYKAAGGMLEMINKMLNPKYERQCTPKVLKNEIKEIEI